MADGTGSELTSSEIPIPDLGTEASTLPASSPTPGSSPALLFLAPPRSRIVLAEGTEVRGRYRYRLECPVGQGGFGSVYKAQRISPASDPDAPPATVALKFFHPPDQGDHRLLLRRELSALLALDHECVIRPFDWRVDRDPGFLALEYLPSGSLSASEFYRDTPCPEEIVAALMADLLSALNAAHRASILHLDIKPGNVMRRENGRFVLTDFGISQGSLVPREVMAAGLGTPGYSAPEQRPGHHHQIGPRTDLWGVGATAWSLLTGLRLDLRQELVREPAPGVIHGLPSLSRFRPCSSELEALIMSLLAVDPAHRPGGAAEALVTLRASGLLSTPSNPAILPSPAGIRTTVGLRVYRAVSPAVREMVDSLIDPIWISICSRPESALRFVRFEQGEELCREGEEAFRTFVLLTGSVVISRAGRGVSRESREGTFLGETATLTGRPRTSTIRAEKPVWALLFNAAELEQFVTQNPAIAIRLIKTLAMRNGLETNYSERDWGEKGG